MIDRYVSASEVNTFVFCRRALWLQRRGAVSLLERERALGAAAHRGYGELARTAHCDRVVAVVLAVAAVALLVVAFR